MSMRGLQKDCYNLGINTTKLKAVAGSSTTPTATTTVAGTVRLAAADPDNASTIPAAAPAGGTGATAGAYDTAANRDALIATVNALRTAVSELKADHNDLLAKLRAAGHVAP